MMKKTKTPRIGVFLLVALLGGGLSGFAQVERPNVVVVMTDDQGYGDFGFNGNPTILTPHLDAMASRSGQMTQFYVSPVCAPTRACLMTGRYNYRTRCIDTYIGRAMMDPDEETMAEIFSTARNLGLNLAYDYHFALKWFERIENMQILKML